jgi:hypothetical protein
MALSLTSRCHLVFGGFRTLKIGSQTCRLFSHQKNKIENCDVHSNFLSNVAQFTPPKDLKVLFQLLKLTGVDIVEPTNRINVNPFLVPIAMEKDGENKLCYLRWPTQRDTMELQLVRTTKVGVELVALNTAHYCQRLVTELEFYSDPAFQSAHELLKSNAISFQPAGYSTLMKSGKFPVQTVNDQRLLLDRYLLTKIAAFPDCYERLAHSHMENNNSISALVTCERMIALFSSWARPMHFHSKMLHRLGNREKEVKESATAAMGMPLWTLATDQEVGCDIVAVHYIVVWFEILCVRFAHALRFLTSPFYCTCRTWRRLWHLQVIRASPWWEICTPSGRMIPGRQIWRRAWTHCRYHWTRPRI